MSLTCDNVMPLGCKIVKRHKKSGCFRPQVLTKILFFMDCLLMLFDSASNSKDILAIMQFYTYESLKPLVLSSQNSSAQPNTLQTVCSFLYACSLYKPSACCV
jgi:hypothetical protein